MLATWLSQLILRQEARKLHPVTSKIRHCMCSFPHFTSLMVAAAHAPGMTWMMGQRPWLYHCVPAMLQVLKVLFHVTCMSFKAQLKYNNLREAFLTSLDMVINDSLHLLPWDIAHDLHDRTFLSTRKYFPHIYICLSRLWVSRVETVDLYNSNS